MRRLTVLSVAFPFAVVSADPVGGAEQVLASIDRALTTSGHRSIVVAAEGSRPTGELVRIPRPGGPIGSAEWANAHDYLRLVVPALIRSTRADIVHMHGVDFHFYLPPPGVPVLGTLHMPLDYYSHEALAPQRPRTWLNTVSKNQQLSAKQDSRIIGTVENGVPIRVRSPVRKRPFSVSMGRICPEKGFHLALEAAKAARTSFRLAGQISGFPEHQQYFDDEIRPRLDPFRRWIGPVSGLLKWRLLASAQSLLAPSLVAETASLVAREAMAAGTPVIAFPNGALADTVIPGVTGFLVRSADEMAHALRRTSEIDPELCRRFARERYSADRMTREYLQLYFRILEA